MGATLVSSSCRRRTAHSFSGFLVTASSPHLWIPQLPFIQRERVSSFWKLPSELSSARSEDRLAPATLVFGAQKNCGWTGGPFNDPAMRRPCSYLSASILCLSPSTISHSPDRSSGPYSPGARTSKARFGEMLGQEPNKDHRQEELRIRKPNGL